MRAWLHNLSASSRARKQNRKKCQPRPGRRAKFGVLKFGLERLEDRSLLSITSETGAAIVQVENVEFSGPVATFTSADNGPFTAAIHWGDGTTTNVSGSSISGGPSPATFTVNGSHTYADEASDALSVVITDASDSTTATATGSATISKGDTLAAAGAATVSATEGTTFSGNVATFTDTGRPGNPATDFSATIHWGDGTTTAGAIVASSGTLTVSGTHVYADEGTKPLSITLADDGPGTATATATGTATVAEGDKLTPGMEGVIDATEGIAFTGKVAYFTNVGYAGNPAADFTAVIDWGDGSTGTGTIGAVNGSAYTVTGSHAYADEGTHTATVILSDDAPGTATGTITDQVSVFDASLTAMGTAVAAIAGTAFTGTVASFTDANPNAPLSDFTATIDWGDGSTTAGNVAANGSGGFNVSGTHTYTSAGTNPILVQIVDVGGSTATATSTPTISSASAEVSISKSAPSTGNVGTNFDYTVTVTNGAGGVSAAAVTMTDTLPAGVTFVSATDTSGGTITHSGSTVTDVVGTLTAGATDRVTIVVTPDSSAVNTTITNSASVTTTTTNIGTPTTASASTSISAQPLAITKSGTPSTINVGGTVIYVITATNSERDEVTGAVVTDVLPAGLTVVSAYPNPPGVNNPTNVAGDTVTINGNTVTDHLGTLGQNGKAFLTIFAKAAPLPSGTTNLTVTNTASLAVAGTTNLTSNAVPTTISTTTPLLSISKAGSAQAYVGGTVTYTITVTNSGGGAATGAVVADSLPAEPALINLQATDPTGTVTISPNPPETGGIIVTDHLGAVPAYGTGTLTITGTVAPLHAGDSGPLENTAALTFAGTTTPSNMVSTVIIPAPVSTGVGFLAGVPGDGTAQTFVQNLYRELLGREPDSAGDSFWVSYVQQHDSAAGRSQVISSFLNSQEYAIHFISTVYQVILGRAPDAGGLQFWTAKMGRPGTPGGATGSADEKAIVAAIFGADEFYIRSGSTAQGWINALYEDILGRPADGSGAAFWSNELAVRGGGDRDGIVRDLLTTPEAAHLVLDSFYPAAGGTSSNPLPVPGAPAGTGSTELAIISGDGWENLYLQGPYDSQPQGNDSFFNALAGGAHWDDVRLLLLETSQFYTNPNRPVTN